SSRRRHTRFSRDWSSDVCSSDLAAKAAGAARTTIWGPGGVATEAETAFGFALRRYRFDVYKTDDDETPDEGAVVFVSAEAEAVADRKSGVEGKGVGSGGGRAAEE